MTSRLRLAALFLISLTGSAAAESDCDTLKTLVRQAPEGFSSYVGGRPEPQSLDAKLDRSPSNISWGDADCTVASGNDVLRCSWAKGSFDDSVKMVSQCLPGAAKVAASGETFFTVPVSHVIVAISGSDGTDDLLIEIRGP